jgi:transposase
MQEFVLTMVKLEGRKIYLACGPTDMRKEINGLAVLVELSFKLDPFAETLFVFCNRRRDRLKILEWGDDGFWLHFKRLEKGHFKWPSSGKEMTMTLSSEELEHLLSGTVLERKLRRDEITQHVIA